jgi:hypothetical protein
MPSKRTGPKQKPKPSKEVLAMVQAVKAKKGIHRKREEICQGSGPDRETSDRGQVAASSFATVGEIPQVDE